jgi:hypothetical protein
MHRATTFRSRRGLTERASSTIDYVGISVAVAVLLAGVAQQFSGNSVRALAAAVPERIAEAVQGDARVSTAHERRTGGGSIPVRVSRDDLRLDPVAMPIAAERRTLDRTVTVAGFDIRLDGEACALCVRIGERHSFTAGASHEGTVGSTGVLVSAQGDVRFALIAAELGARVERSIGFGFGPKLDLSLQGRVRGLVGAEVNASAKARIGPHEQTIEASGMAMAGASARAEARVGLGLKQSGRAEGWAGAGAQGNFSISHTGSSVSWDVGWGAALGLGGAAGWSGTVDVSGVSPEHRAIARTLIFSALGAVSPAFMGAALQHTNQDHR